MSRSMVVLGVLSVTASPAWAQGVVQLPSVQTNSVNTAVSVPDGGNILLGGVSTARAGQRNAGLIPFGSSVGRGVGNSSMRAAAAIHDFEAMDKLLLGMKSDREESVYIWRNPVAKYSWDRLHGRDSSLKQSVLEVASQTALREYDPQAPPEPRREVSRESAPAATSAVPEGPPVRVTVAAGPRPRNSNSPIGRLLDLGDRAMSRNKPGVAVGFYRGAARLGSEEAEAKIREIVDQLSP